MREKLERHKSKFFVGFCVFLSVMFTSSDKVLAQNGVVSNLGTNVVSKFEAIEALPAWRWSGGTSSLYTNLGVSDVGANIVTLLSALFFGLSSFIWSLMLAIVNISTNFFYSVNLANMVNSGWAATFNAIANTNFLGVIIFLLFSSAVFRALTSSLRDLGVKQIFSGLLFIGIFMVLGFQARDATGNADPNSISFEDISSSGNAEASPWSPGGITIGLVSAANGTIASLASDLVGAGTNDFSAVNNDVLDCVNYEKKLEEIWFSEVPSDPNVLGLDTDGFAKEYMQLVSNTWKSSHYEMWKNAQFGQSNPFGDRTACWFLESDADVPVGTAYLRGVLGESSEGTTLSSVDSYVHGSTNLNAQDVCEAANDATDGLWWSVVAAPVSFVFNNGTCSAAGVLPDVESGGDGELLQHGTDAVFRRHILAFASCSYDGPTDTFDASSATVWSVDGSLSPWGESFLDNGKGVTDDMCAEWLQTGLSEGVGSNDRNPWSYSNRDDIRSSTANSPEVRDFILSFNGHNSSALVFSFFSIAISIIVLWYIGRMSVGLILASVASVLYGVFAPIFLLFLASGIPSIRKIGEASLRRWVSAVFASTAIMLFLSAVLFANRLMQAIVDLMFTNSVADTFITPFLFSLSTIAAFWMVTGFAKRNNMTALTNIKGMRDWAAQSYVSANSQGNWNSHMGFNNFGQNNGKIRNTLRQSYRTGMLGDIRENALESFIRQKDIKNALGIGISKDERALRKEKGRSHLRDKIRKSNPEIAVTENNTRKEKLMLEEEYSKIAEKNLSGEEKQKQRQQLEELSKLIKDRERTLKGLDTDPKRYLEVNDEIKEAHNAEQLAIADINKAFEENDLEGLQLASSLLEEASSKRQALEIEKEMLEKGYVTSRKKQKDMLNARVAQVQGEIPPPPPNEIILESIEEELANFIEEELNLSEERYNLDDISEYEIEDVHLLLNIKTPKLELPEEQTVDLDIEFESLSSNEINEMKATWSAALENSKANIEDIINEEFVDRTSAISDIQLMIEQPDLPEVAVTKLNNLTTELGNIDITHEIQPIRENIQDILADIEELELTPNIVQELEEIVMPALESSDTKRIDIINSGQEMVAMETLVGEANRWIEGNNIEDIDIYEIVENESEGNK